LNICNVLHQCMLFLWCILHFSAHLATAIT